jgi:putative aldouronate transport system permease protein
MAGLQLAFKEVDMSRGYFGGDFVGLKHFKTFFNSYVFGRILRNTVWINFCYFVLGFPAPIILAISINEAINARLKKTVQLVTYAPHFISTVVMVSIIMQLLSPYTGLINKVIQIFGKEPINFMGRPEYFVLIYVLSGIWQGMGYVSIVFIGALSTVDPELYDASRIDGATKLQKILHIDLPCIMPTIITMMILNMGSLMNVGFEKVYLMQNEMNITASDVISTHVYHTGLIQGEYGYATAVGFFNSTINLIMVVLFNTIARRVSETSLW